MQLLALARGATLQTLRDAGRKRRLAAIAPEDLQRQQQDSRRFRHWRDDLGMVCFAGALPPATGIPFVNRMDAETDRVRRAGRRCASARSS